METRTVRSRDGTSIAWKTRGAGPNLVLVAGSAADHHDWDLVVPELEASFTCHVIDRRGRGASGDAPAYALQREAEDLLAVIEAVGGAAVLAHSYGALCALEASALSPASIRSLVLYEPPFFDPPGEAPMADEIDALVTKGEPEAALVAFLRDAVGVPEAEIGALREQAPELWTGMVRTAPTLARELRTASAFRFEPARYTRVQVPTLLLGGTLSPPFFGEALRALRGALSTSRLEWLEGQAHGALLEAPLVLARKVREHVGA